MEQVLAFDEALQASAGQNHRHLLLGNGFSRACRDDIFAYGALFERADFQSLSPHARSAFDALETADFEVVIDALKKASTLVSTYSGSGEGLPEVFTQDAEGLREVLVSAIAGSHPDLPADIPPESYAACKQFLRAFERVFTLNYDLLLYWAYMQSEIEPQLEADDGFRRPDSGEEEYVTWEVENAYNQKIYYLHGALHLFDAGSELQKYTWVNTGIRLTEQIRQALANDKFPMFVAEGDSDSKLDKIKHSAYLTKAFDSFSKIGGALFLYGHSMAENDEHFLRLIEQGKVSQLFVGLYGDQDKPANQHIINRAKLIQQHRDAVAARRRRSPNPLEVYFYDAQSAHVWG